MPKSTATVAATATTAKGAISPASLNPLGVASPQCRTCSTGRVAVPSDLPAEHLNDPRLYGMQLDGHCLEPRIAHGSMLILSPAAPLVRDQAVAMHFRDGRQAQVKMLVALPPPALIRAMAKPGSEVAGAILVDMPNPGRLLTFPLADLAGVHAVVGVIPPGEFTVRQLEPVKRAPRRAVQA